MSDEHALLAAIWEQPHDDTPRLVYADWLQENGQSERGEFIRVQCELARLDAWDETARPALERREKHLWTKHAKAWKADLPKPLQQAGFHRGFPHPRRREVRVTQFLQMPADDFAAAPLWSFSLPSAPASLDKLLACRNLPRVGSVLLSDWIGGEWMHRRFPPKGKEKGTPAERFAASSNVRNLAELDLHWSGDLGDDGLAALADGAANLPHLRKLWLWGCNVTDKGVKALAASPLASGLTSLNLQGNERVRTESIGVLFAPEAFPRLAELLLPTTIGVAGLRALAKGPPNPTLRKLAVYVEEKADLGAFLDWPGLESVRDLDLLNSLIRDRVGPLFRAPRLSELRILRMEAMGNKPADIGAFDALAADRTLLPKLRELHLRFAQYVVPEATVERLRARFGSGLTVD